MTPPTCGTRAQYQQGCRCLPCRAAEATYRAELRRKRVRGLPVLGAYISASEAWARIRVLKQERFTNRQITGRQDHHAPAITAQGRVRLVTLIRLRALCQRYLIEDGELPLHQPGPELPPTC